MTVEDSNDFKISKFNLKLKICRLVSPDKDFGWRFQKPTFLKIWRKHGSL